MKLITITTWNNRLYKEYAHRFEATYNWSWPYTVYNEDDINIPISGVWLVNNVNNVPSLTMRRKIYFPQLKKW